MIYHISWIIDHIIILHFIVRSLYSFIALPHSTTKCTEPDAY